MIADDFEGGSSLTCAPTGKWVDKIVGIQMDADKLVTICKP